MNSGDIKTAWTRRRFHLIAEAGVITFFHPFLFPYGWCMIFVVFVLLPLEVLLVLLMVTIVITVLMYVFIGSAGAGLSPTKSQQVAISTRWCRLSATIIAYVTRPLGWTLREPF